MPAIQQGGASAPGLVAPERPTKDEALAGCTAQGFEGQGREDEADCSDSKALRKRLATARAVLALQGVTLDELSSGAFVASTPGMLARFTDLAAVEAWARAGRGAA